ncbi:MAG: hypothetical protein WBC05_14640 [Sedimentisphaerales bacterium]
MLIRKGVTAALLSLILMSYCLEVVPGGYFAEAYNYLCDGDLTKRRLTA